MKLTPQDISNQNFASKIKGFDRDEVKNFLMQVVETLENEIKEKEGLSIIGLILLITGALGISVTFVF